MSTPKNAEYKQRQRKRPQASLWHGRGRSRAHPDREYRIGPGGAVWRKDTYEARFGRPNSGKWHDRT